MSYLLEVLQSVVARGDRLSDVQLGMLLADLQLGDETIVLRRETINAS